MEKNKKIYIVFIIAIIIDFLIFGYLIYSNIRLNKKINDLQYKIESTFPLYDTGIKNLAEDIEKIQQDKDIKENKTENNTTKAETSKTEEGYYQEYYIEDNKCYTNFNGEKKQILTPTEIVDIAEKEAKNQKYQYQKPRESEFYARGKNTDDPISIQLMVGLDDISKSYHWTEEWKKADYENRIMWKIRLFDENDPLTSLYIYIDSNSGEIIGAGKSSD